jgi:hypothetical protein
MPNQPPDREPNRGVSHRIGLIELNPALVQAQQGSLVKKHPGKTRKRGRQDQQQQIRQSVFFHR